MTQHTGQGKGVVRLYMSIVFKKLHETLTCIAKSDTQSASTIHILATALENLKSVCQKTQTICKKDITFTNEF